MAKNNLEASCEPCENGFKCRFRSSEDGIDFVEERVQVWLSANRTGADAFSIRLIVREALTNAVFHGNRNDPAKEVFFTLEAEPHLLRIQVEDQGQGFNWRDKVLAPLEPTAKRGRGLTILQTFSRSARYNEKGNVLTVLIDAEGVQA